MQLSEAEVKEIERHKYFLSEKQGRDVGWDFAQRDWESQYAPKPPLIPTVPPFNRSNRSANSEPPTKPDLVGGPILPDG